MVRTSVRITENTQVHWVLRRREIAHLETMGSWGEAHFKSYFNEGGGAGEMAREELRVGLVKDGESGRSCP